MVKRIERKYSNAYRTATEPGPEDKGTEELSLQGIFHAGAAALLSSVLCPQKRSMSETAPNTPDISPHPEGSALAVRAQPGAKRNEVAGIRDGMLLVRVTQAPEKGKANKAIALVIAKSLGLRRSQVELLSGETSRQKRFLIREMPPEELRIKLLSIQ